MNIGSFEINQNSKTFIIAELSANHNQNFDLAVETIRAAKKSGADAIKIQTYTPDTITIDCSNDYFKIKQGTIWDGRTLYNLYEEAYTPWEWHEELQRVAIEEELVFFSSPFDKTAVDLLERLNVPVYKVASFEITDIPLIEYIASKRKPIIISNGIASLDDMKEAVEACKRMGNNQIAILKCTSAYPAPYEEINLLTIPDIKERFGVITGLSDHTLGTAVPIAAVACGAKIIEKHFIMDRKMGGPDSQFSMEPHEFREMVDSIRLVEKALGKISYELSDKMIKNRQFSRSLFIVKDVKAGETVTEENVRSIRPGFGMHTRYFKDISGKRFNSDYEKGTPMSWEQIKK